MSSTALPQILTHVPAWVWFLLLVLIALGLSQSRDRWVGAARLRLMPLVFLAFSAWSTVSAFGWQAFTVLGFLAGLAASRQLVLASGWPGVVRYDAARHAYFVPGSWVPLALMMGIFALKFMLGMLLAMNPQLPQQAAAVLGLSALNGTLGALFLARARNMMGHAAHAA